MKYLAVFFISFLSVLPMVVSADVPAGINILSQSYSISAPWNYEWDVMTNNPNGNQYGPIGVNYSSDSGSYGGTSNDGTPVSGSFIIPNNPPGIGGGLLNGSASIDTFAFHTYAYAGNNSPLITGSDGRKYFLGRGAISTSAQASWLFQPIIYNQQLTLNINGYYWYGNQQQLSMSLSDVTSSTTLLAYSQIETGAHNTFHSYTFVLNPNDTYQLSIAGNIGAFAGDYQGQDVTASIIIVPEPATFGLFSLGLLVFLASRKSFRVD